MVVLLEDVEGLDKQVCPLYGHGILRFSMRPDGSLIRIREYGGRVIHVRTTLPRGVEALEKIASFRRFVKHSIKVKYQFWRF